MKKVYILARQLFCLAFLFAMSCNAQPEKKTITTMGTGGAVLDVSYYPDDNNIPKSIVVLKDGFIISGQKFTKQGATLQPSAIIKISPEGKLIREVFLGKDLPGEKAERLENLLRIDTNRIIFTGHKAGKLWIREINDNLDVMRDTVFPSIPVNWLVLPKPFLAEDGFYLVCHPPGITYIDKDFQKVEYTSLAADTGIKNYSRFYLVDAIFHKESSSFYIIGNECFEKKGSDCIEYKNVLIVYNTKTKSIQSKLTLPQFHNVKAIKEAGGIFYICGEGIPESSPRPTKRYPIPKNLELVVSFYNLQNKMIRTFNFDEPEPEYIDDMDIVNDKIYLAGKVLDSMTGSFKSLYLGFDLKGTLVEKRVFGNNPLENWLTKLYHTNDGKRLLLGKGKGWRIILFN